MAAAGLDGLRVGKASTWCCTARRRAAVARVKRRNDAARVKGSRGCVEVSASRARQTPATRERLAPNVYDGGTTRDTTQRGTARRCTAAA